MTPDSSPLGRYGSDEGPGGELVEVVLLNVPLLVLADGREHHEGLMREFRLMALDDRLPQGAAPSRLAELTELLGRTYAPSSVPPNQAAEAAMRRGERSVNLVYRVPVTVVEDARTLETLMALADEFCEQEQLLTLARTPLMRRFATWYLQQFIDQIGGHPPRPWDGPDTP